MNKFCYERSTWIARLYGNQEAAGTGSNLCHLSWQSSNSEGYIQRHTVPKKIKLNIFYVLLFSFWLKSFALKYDLMMLDSKSKPDLFSWRKIRRRLIYLKAQLTLNFIFQRYRRIVKGSFLSKPVVLKTITGTALDLVFLFLVTCHASDCVVCPKILLSSGYWLPQDDMHRNIYF